MGFPTGIANLSPMMKQYLEIKKQHMDKILMYRLGDFYEMFFDDAVTASRELELTLTGRDCGLPERAPMCGVPYHAVESYIGKLVAHGYKVAICEQMEDPATAKGVVKRDIIRIITPGTVTEDSMLSEGRNNYIAALLRTDDFTGICFADISTGVTYVTEFLTDDDLIFSEIARFAPKEIIIDERTAKDREFRRSCARNTTASVDVVGDTFYDGEHAKNIILDTFTPDKYAKLSRLSTGTAVKALGAVLKYLRDTQFSGSARMVDLEVYSVSQYLSMSPQCRRNLELTENMQTLEKKGSLLWVIDRTVTSMGRRAIRGCIEKPLVDVKEINRRLDAVQELCSDIILRSKTRENLKSVFDIERLMTRVAFRSVTPRDMQAFVRTCDSLEKICQIAPEYKAPLLRELAADLDTEQELCERIRNTIDDDPPALVKDGGYIRPGFSAEIDELRELLRNTKDYLSKMEAELKETTGIKNLKIGFNKAFGYYIEVSKSQTGLVPDYFIRRQTLTTGERYVTAEMKELENRIIGGSDRLQRLEKAAYDELCDAMLTRLETVQRTAKAAAMLDVISAFAYVAAENGYVKPTVDASSVIEIRNGRHPVVEQFLESELFVPNDTLLDCDKNLVNVITGPNMAGKSTYMRQTAIMVIMAQIGCFVPAASARIGIVDAIFTRIGSADNIFAGDSTFMVEMKEVAYTLRNATKRSLIILDEIGRGTSTYDGMSIARAVIETICRQGGIGAKTMFATHYHELTDLDTVFDNVKNYNIAAKKRGDDIVFLRRIVKGPADDSYGIEVAKLAGIPEQTIADAKRALKDLLEKTPEIRRVREDPEEKGRQKQMAEIYNQVKNISIETLTPIEAMYLLNDLSKAANAEIPEE